MVEGWCQVCGVAGQGVLLEAVGSCFSLVLLNFLSAMMNHENMQVADDVLSSAGCSSSTQLVVLGGFKNAGILRLRHNNTEQNESR